MSLPTKLWLGARATACFMAGALLLAGVAIAKSQVVTYSKLPRDMQVYPRDVVANTAAVEVAGLVLTPGFDKALLSVFRDGALHGTHSQDLVYSAGAAPFAFSHTIVAELKNYDFEVRLVAGTVTNLVTRVTNVVAGDFYMANGQSNADAGRGESNTNQSPFLRSFGTRSSQASVVTNDLVWRLAEGSQSQGPAAVGSWCMRFGRLVVDTYQIPVAIQSASLAATAISYFQRDDSNHENPNNNYGRLLFRMREAGCTNRVRAYFYWQGETDRLNPSSHVSGFSAIYTRWQEDYPNLEKVYLHQIRQGFCSTTNYYDTGLRNSQRLFHNSLSKVTTMSANALDGHDGCHWAYGGYKQAGERLFAVVARDLYGSSQTNNIEAPDIQSAYAGTPDRRTVTLVMRNATDTLVMDAGAENDFFCEGINYLSPVSGSVSSNTIVLVFPTNCLAATGISYTGHPFDGAWVKNGSGVGLLTFQNVPIAFPYVALPGVENPQGAGAVTAGSADLRGTLVNEGDGPTHVFACWGGADGGTNQNAWDAVLPLGVRSGNGANISTVISDLTPGAQYFYRYFASNSAGIFWANASSAFRTAVAVNVTTAGGATNITATSATFQAALQNAGTSGASTRVILYWGDTDGGTNSGEWQNLLDCGLRSPGAFTTNISGLQPATRHFYRCFGSNALGAAWSTNTATFPTRAATESFSSQCRITFTGYTRTEALTNFPALVVLSENIPGFSYAQFGSSHGDDLRFYDSSNNELNYEVDSWDFNGGSYVWVQVPRLTNSAFITARWGSTNASTPAYTTNGATWSDGYVGVWHMSPQSPIRDSTSAKNHGAPFGNVASTNGIGAGAQWLDGQKHKYKWLTWEEPAGIDLTHFARPDNLTISAWILAPPFAAYREIVGWTPTANAAEFRLTDLGRLWYGEATTNTIQSIAAASSIADGALKFVSMTHQADGVTRLFVDGAQVASGTISRFPSTTALRIGARNSDDYNFSGLMDEVRVEKVARSSNWIWACRMNVASNQTFLTYGAVTNLVNTTAVANASADTVTFNSATLNGILLWTNTSPTHVSIYWGDSDGGTNAGAWANVALLGARPLGAFSNTVSGLSANTVYNFRSFASNAVEQVWADSTATFTTLSGQPLIQNSAPGEVEVSSATLNGNLISTGSDAPLVWVYWGTNDSGTNKNSWPFIAAFGERTSGLLATNVTGLNFNTTYFSRYYASNAAGEAWASPAVSFTTLNPLPLISNSTPVNITTNAATLIGQLVSTGAAPSYVQVFWGTNDGGTLRGSWPSVANLGFSPTGSVSANLTGLLQSTRYYFRFVATNSFGESWAGASESFFSASPGGGGGTWCWDKGGDSNTWANANNWSNVTAQVDNLGFPNGSGAVALKVGGIISSNPQNITLGELYGTSALTLGSDAGTTTNTLTFDNNGAHAVFQHVAATSGFIYYHVNVLSDLHITNDSSSSLSFYRRLITGPGRELHITTLNTGTVRFSVEDPASGYNTFGNLHLHENSTLVVSEALRNPARSPLGQGVIHLYGGSKLSVILRLSLTNQMALLGNATLAYDGTRVDGVQLNGEISGPGRFTVDNTGATSIGNVKLGGSSPNTFAGGIIVKGAAGSVTNFLVLQKNGAAGTGDLFLTNQFARLQITDAGPADNRVSDNAALFMAHSGTNYAKVALDSGVNETVENLYFDNVLQAPGTWGSTASAAANKNDSWFGGTGILTVTGTPDSDGDGMLDGWEIQYFGNITTASATSDTDGDGMKDVDEYRAGTNPTNPLSRFILTGSFHDMQSGATILEWQSATGRFYNVHQTSNFLESAWESLATNLTATPPINTYTTPPSAAKSLFFRLSTQ